MIVALKIVHVAFAAAWFGHKLLIAGDVRESVHAPQETGLFVRRINRAERLGQTSGILTLLTGLGLIYLDTGFTDAPLRIYLGLAIVIILFLVGFLVTRPAWKMIRAGLQSGDSVNAASGEPGLRRALMLENLLWLLALGTMVSA